MTAAERIREAALCVKNARRWAICETSPSDFDAIMGFKCLWGESIFTLTQIECRAFLLFVAEAMESENA